MIRKKRVYICDHCGAAALEQTEAFCTFYSDTFKTAPEGWTKLGSEDLCPVCSEAYRRFRYEVVKENRNG